MGSSIRSLFVVLAFGLVGPSAAAAQASPAAVDSFLVLVPLRPLESIREDVDRARLDAQGARDARGVAEELNLRNQALIDEQKLAIERLNDRVKAAKDAKREAEVVALEAEKRGAERVKDLLERRKALREAEIDLAKAGLALAEAAERAAALEAELAGQRAAAGAATDVPGSGGLAARRVLRELEKRTLEAMKALADRRVDHAERERQVAERRLQTLAAQSRLLEIR